MVRQAAAMVLLGLPGLRYLTTEDRDERLMLLGVQEEAMRQHQLLQRNLATEISNAIVRSRRG